jgi:hypothetical protein
LYIKNIFSIIVIGAMLITTTSVANACGVQQQQQQKKQTNSPMIALGSSGLSSTSTNNNSAATIAPPATNMPQPNAKFNKPNTTTMTTTTPGAPIQTGKQKLEVQKKIRASFPSLIVLVDLGMPHKNTTDYGIVDLTVTLHNITKIRSLNATKFVGDHIVMPFRFSPKNDKIPIQTSDKYTACASGEFLDTAVCQTGIVKTKAPPISRTTVELG